MNNTNNLSTIDSYVDATYYVNNGKSEHNKLVLKKLESFDVTMLELYGNVIYEITSDYDLNGATITLPDGCCLFFNGGSYSNGNLIVTGKCLLKRTRDEIFIDMVFSSANNSSYFINAGIDSMFSGSNLQTLKNLSYFESVELTKNYDISPDYNEFIITIWDRSFHINGNGHSINLSGYGGSFLKFDSDSNDNRGKTLFIENLKVFALENSSSINTNNYYYYALLSLKFCASLELINTELLSTGICITNYGGAGSQFTYRKNSITINRSTLKSDYFVIEDGAEFIYIDNSTLSAYLSYNFLNDIISNGYDNYTVNINISNSIFIGGIEIKQGDISVSNCILFEYFNVGVRDEVENYNDINVVVTDSIFTEKVYSGDHNHWEGCKYIRIASCKFATHVYNWEIMIYVGVCGKLEIVNCDFDPSDITLSETMYLLFLSDLNKIDSINFFGNCVNSPLNFTASIRIDISENSLLNNQDGIEIILSKFNSLANNINFGSTPNFVLQYLYENVTYETAKYNHYFFDNVNKEGVTSNRPLFVPTKPYVGYNYFDTSLTKPIFRSSNASWVDATGSSV